MKIRLLKDWKEYPRGVVIEASAEEVAMLVKVNAAVVIDKPICEVKEIKTAPVDKQVKGSTTKTKRKTKQKVKHGS